MISAAIPVVTVSYNTPELLDNLLSTFREKYPENPFYIVDGSDEQNLQKVKLVVAKFKNVFLKDFGYNIHHGPGMAWAINNFPLSGSTLFLDSDIEVVREGFIENLLELLKPEMYGVGAVGCINRDGFNVDDTPDGIKYLHPICMLCNIEVVRQWPLPVKHGAPMTETMLALHDSGMSHLVQNVPWVMNDIAAGNQRIFIDHKGQGTVFKTGGYHLGEWMKEFQEKNSKTIEFTIDLNNYNHELLHFIPKKSSNLVEVGCSFGTLAAAYKKINPNCFYQGIEIDSIPASIARNYCNSVIELDIESVGAEFFNKFSKTQCWIFGDVLEHLKNPWRLLSHIRSVIPADGSIIACIPNAQHWSIQAKLAIGDFRYDPNGGLLDKTHLRWFTRQTIFELFSEAGFQIVEGCPRIFNEPMRDKVVPVIREMAKSLGINPEIAVNDALPMQYIVRAIPINNVSS